MTHEAALYDPLLHDVALPLTGTFHALGFPVRIATNSQLALDAAAESWGMYPPSFPTQPVEFHIVALPDGRRAPVPVVRTQRHHFSLVADRHNFGAYDSATFFGYCYVSEKTLADRAWFRFHFLETVVYMLLAQRYTVPLHAACVARGERGILLYGHSGAGKSTLSWAAARLGWTYVTDDGAWLLPDAEEPTVLGRSHQIRFKPDALRLFPELRQVTPRPSPTGKNGLEFSLESFAHIRTAWRSPIAAVVVLVRKAGVPARIESIPPSEVSYFLLADMPRYAKDVRERYRMALERLLRVPCYRLIYRHLDDAIHILADLT